jgi:hypothetical protein
MFFEKEKEMVINATPHLIRLVNKFGVVYEVPPCGTVINAKPVGVSAGRHPSGAELVRVSFETDEANMTALARLEEENPGAVIVGSMIAAQAFPGRVMAMVAAPGFERVPPDQKRMRDDKFTIF